jgi:hypothetical protein
MGQILLTFLTRVKPDKVSDLKEFLQAEFAGDRLLDNPYIPFCSLTRLHFASLVVNEDETYGPYLWFENNFDGPLETYLDELYTHSSQGLHRIYSYCLEYSAVSAADREQILSYLRKHIVRPNAYHIGNVGRNVDRTKKEDGLRDKLENFLDDLARKGPSGQVAGLIRQKVQDFMRRESEFAWAGQADPRQTWMEWVKPRLKLGLLALIAFLLLPILIPLVIVWALVLRYKETRDPAPDKFDDINERVGKLVEREDRTHVVQNHLAHMTVVKPGIFRRATLWLVLWLVNLIARTSDKGKLNGIPSIHYAHWSMIDKGRRLLFVSNFDGSWENYLDDFIDKASYGLTGVWSNTVDFPRTFLLVGQGAKDGTRFKAWARDKQVHTDVWYSAYPSLTVETIDNNTDIREQLFTPKDETQAREWVWRF